MYKKVKNLIPAEDIDMGGISVKQALPTHHVPGLDPFLLLHHGEFHFRDDAAAHHQGVGPHPHRGFSPVTFVIEGEVRHRDSRGNDQVAVSGEVQWMHAGAGIIHSERPTQRLVEQNEKQEIIQLWINSPAVSKMNQPLYQYRSENDIINYLSEDKKVNHKLLAGTQSGFTGNIKTESELLVIWSAGTKDGMATYHIPQGYNTMIYTIKGEITMKGHGIIEPKHLAILSMDNDTVEVSTRSESQYLILAGKPLEEKITQSGPYVMNTQTEIMEAMRDYQMGKMGILIEEP